MAARTQSADLDDRVVAAATAKVLTSANV